MAATSKTTTEGRTGDCQSAAMDLEATRKRVGRAAV